MAKALYGFHGGPDPRVQAELSSLRARVRQLEAELEALRSEPLEMEIDSDLDLRLMSPADAALV